MGLICELYRIDDATIDRIVGNPKWGFDFILYNYAEVGGCFHKQNNTVFSTDKAWAIADYLISKFAKSKGKEVNVLGDMVEKDNSGSDGLRVIKSQEVKRNNEVIKQIDTSTISEFYDREEIIRNYKYRADWIEEVDDYVISHVAKIKEAYCKAASTNEGLVVRIG
jgi:hypothetical protein